MMPRAKKSFGQHWLVDETVVRKIIDAAQIEPGEYVLEIGPGTGVLTQALVDAGARVSAIEADPTLIPALRERFGDSIELIEGDILSVPFSRFTFHASRYKLIANIPYNITSDLLRRFLIRHQAEPGQTSPGKPSRMILMVQKEVADRITATPPNMSLLSVVCQIYADCRRVTNVSAGAFRPIPKVDSAIVRLDPITRKTHTRTDRPLYGLDPEDVIAVAKLGFSSPRKQLHGNLKVMRRKGSMAVKEALIRIGLSSTARAEVLTVENWIRLTHILREDR